MGQQLLQMAISKDGGKLAALIEEVEAHAATWRRAHDHIRYNYAMFTDEGNAAVALIVAHAVEYGTGEDQLQDEVWKLADVDSFREAPDTDVGESWYEEMLPRWESLLDTSGDEWS